MRYVVVYESGDDLEAKAPLHFAAHKARWQEFRDRGELLMIGPYSDRSGSLSVFTTREAAEAFVKDDPFVVHGVVRAYRIHEWNEAIGSI